jgi:hypothetical protein
MIVILATREAKVGETPLSLAPGKSRRLYLYSKLRTKGLECGSSGRVSEPKFNPPSTTPPQVHRRFMVAATQTSINGRKDNYEQEIPYSSRVGHTNFR